MEEALVEAERSLVRSLEEEEGEAGMVEVEEAAWLH